MTQNIALASGDDERDDGSTPPCTFDDFYRDAQPKLARIARQMFGDMGEDLVAQAMIKAFLRWPKIQSMHPGARFNYVKKIMVREGIRHDNRERNFRIRLPQFLSSQSTAPVESQVLDKIAAAKALKLTDLLPTRQRIVLVMLLEGHSFEETAQFMNVTQSTVRSHLHQARKNLQSVIDKEGAEDA
ncbi:sigma-70 family RNA polymerase sigma factor [Actinoplanes sp. KI2]|uniref:RNA polymerase sigma factor n=1 Tax=Actinoplanes sp. KI2 TaxID=2983315 RepID=UPI0021D58609|nr:sigma-70 family RNA polymerase sigma factor [Actinoplanes sp. KI2]MCU7725077.1 sigma-70 family RNA polymerase sigma factor [Actinoplanes sp. KI2]